jgi:hypothetical protein
MIKNTLTDFGSLNVDNFLRLSVKPLQKGYQSCDSFFDVVYRQVFSLLGETIAQKTVRNLKQNRMVMTANHHGVDYFAQSVQGSLLFSMLLSSLNPKCRTIPIFSCGNVPLNNLTYPRGLMVYQANPSSIKDIPLKIPVYSDRLKRSIVSSVNAFNLDMIRSAQNKIKRLVSKNVLSDGLASTINTILEEDYGSESVLNADSYSRQSTLVNHRLWKRLFSEAATASDIVYIELEKIVADLLEIDFSDEKSLAWAVMFDPELRELVLNELDGERICWNNNKLSARLQLELLTGNKRKKISNCGTHFFWGIDSSFRRIPLCIESAGSNEYLLKGKDDQGENWKIPFKPEFIIKGLKEGRLLPSLFTSYLTVSLARAITCIGGYYQGVYLPLIQKGVVKALEQIGSYGSAVEHVSKANTHCYISGMQTVMVPCGDDALIAAGPLEIIHSGGLGQKDLNRLRRLSVSNAHLASCIDTTLDIAARENKPSDWKKILSKECYNLLANKVVVKC